MRQFGTSTDWREASRTHVERRSLFRDKAEGADPLKLWSNYGPLILTNRYFLRFWEPPASRIFNQLLVDLALSPRWSRSVATMNKNNNDDQQSTSNSADAVEAALIIVPACSKIPFLRFGTSSGIAMTRVNAKSFPALQNLQFLCVARQGSPIYEALDLSGLLMCSVLRCCSPVVLLTRRSSP